MGLTVGQSAFADFGDSRHDLCVACMLNSDTPARKWNRFVVERNLPEECLGSKNSVPFSVPLEILGPRISKYLGSPSRGLKLL
jgi:hypothetical protein